MLSTLITALSALSLAAIVIVAAAIPLCGVIALWGAVDDALRRRT